MPQDIPQESPQGIHQGIPHERPAVPLLDSINNPQQLRKLSQHELPQLANELRQFLMYSVGQTGGHLGAGLGVVELTIALHYVFNTPTDQLVWDVGHQCYPHKILTERRERMDSIRQQDGLAPFPSREESEYDVFGAGHSSTSISAAMGIAEAGRILGQNHRTVAIIGDGAMTAGMAFEALNNAGDMKSNVLVILNDNAMSISHNVGALSKYFAKFMAGKTYLTLKELVKPGLDHIPLLRQFMHQTEEGLKHLFLPPSAFFETLGFNYTGILDGHNLTNLISVLQNIKDIQGARILHIKTCKGKGFAAAEKDPVGYHALTKIAPAAQRQSPKTKKIKYTDVFSQWICDVAAKDDKVVAITPAMREGSGLVEFSQSFSDRYYDVGIAEQHSLTMAAGMACRGIKPVVAIYSTFLQRGYDQLIHDICLQNLPVIFAVDRAGLVGEDGPTHHGSYDLSFLRCIPNMTVMTPSDENETYRMLSTALSLGEPVAVRYPRGEACGIDFVKNSEPLEVGKGRIVQTRKLVESPSNSAKSSSPALLVFGAPLIEARAVADKYNLTIADMRFAKPLDEELIISLAGKHTRLVTIEENVIKGGAGSSVVEFLARNNIECDILMLGIPDDFITHGSQDSLRHKVGLDADSIANSITTKWQDIQDIQDIAAD